MKRISIVIAFLLVGITFSQAQTNPGPNPDLLKKKLEKSDKNIQDPKKSAAVKTWIERASLLYDVADVYTQYLRPGMASTEAKLFLKDPKETKTYPDGKEEYVYDGFSLTFENGKLKYWKQTSFILPDALDQSFESYKKALDMDKDGKFNRKITDGLILDKKLYEKNALNAYSQDDYKASYENFKNEVAIGEMKEVNVVDSAIIYYTGITAQQAGLKQEALKYFQKSVEINYSDPTLYTNMSKLYAEVGDSAKALEILQLGFQKYPSSVTVIVELINYYLMSGNSDAALQYIQKAKENDPNNKSFFFAEGTLFDKMGQMDNAVTAYKKALEIDPDYFDANYNLGVVYFNNAVKLTDAANNEMDNAKWAEKKKIADDEFKKVIPYMEKAYEICDKSKEVGTPENKKSVLSTLKTIYYRLKMTDDLDRVQKLLDAIQ